MPVDERHDAIRRRIVSKNGVGAKLVTQSGKRKAILSTISVDPKMRFITWEDDEMKEFLLKFLSHEPNWKTKTHKFDSFGDFVRKERRMERHKGLDGLDSPVHIRINAEPEKVRKSLEKLGCKVTEDGHFTYSSLAKKFFNRLIHGGDPQKVLVDFLASDDPIRYARVMRR
jgi:hypothetical protein